MGRKGGSLLRLARAHARIQVLDDEEDGEGGRRERGRESGMSG